jgi:hypothetical protein
MDFQSDIWLVFRVVNWHLFIIMVQIDKKEFKLKIQLKIIKRKKKNQSVNWKKLILYGLPIGLGVLLILFILSLHWISSDVRETCKKAQQEFEGDCVRALIAYLESDNLSFKEKNHVIWALGEIDDRRALPTLQRLYTCYFSLIFPSKSGHLDFRFTNLDL